MKSLESKLTLRDRVAMILSDAVTQLIVFSIFIVLTILENNVAYFLGIGYIFLTLWARQWDWQWFGLIKPGPWGKVWLQATGFALLIFLIGDLLITPLVESWTGVPIDVSALDGIRGNLLGYLIFSVFMWIVAAFGEEFVYRGFLIERISSVFGHTKTAQWITAIGSAVLFGLAHEYQGVSGMITTGLFGFAFGVIFLTNKNRLWLTVLTHGIYDMIGITLIYLDKERVVYELISWFG